MFPYVYVSAVRFLPNVSDRYERKPYSRGTIDGTYGVNCFIDFYVKIIYVRKPNKYETYQKRIAYSVSRSWPHNSLEVEDDQSIEITSL